MRVNLPRMRVKEMELHEFLPPMRVTAPRMRAKKHLFRTVITPYEYTCINIYQVDIGILNINEAKNTESTNINFITLKSSRSN